MNEMNTVIIPHSRKITCCSAIRISSFVLADTFIYIAELTTPTSALVHVKSMISTCEMDPQTGSPLFSLPRALRDIIYTMTFEDNEYDRIQDGPPGILLACRRSHAEAIEVFYKTTVFFADDRLSHVSWLGRLPLKYRRLITRCREDRYIFDQAKRDTNPVVIKQCEKLFLTRWNDELELCQIHRFFAAAKITMLPDEPAGRPRHYVTYMRESSSA